MSLAVVWTPRAEHDLRALPWRAGERVDREVLYLAHTGEGDVTRDRPDAPTLLRLRVRPYAVVFSVDTTASTIYVWRVIRAR